MPVIIIVYEFNMLIPIICLSSLSSFNKTFKYKMFGKYSTGKTIHQTSKLMKVNTDNAFPLV